MNTRTAATVAAMGIALGCFGSACHRNPRLKRGRRDLAANGADATAEKTTSPAGAQGSELARATSGATGTCVDILESFMKCTSQQKFLDAISKGSTIAGVSRTNFMKRVDFLREPGGRRQTCQQLLDPKHPTPFQNPATLERLSKATEHYCVNFAHTLEQTQTLEPIVHTNVQ